MELCFWNTLFRHSSFVILSLGLSFGSPFSRIYQFSVLIRRIAVDIFSLTDLELGQLLDSLKVNGWWYRKSSRGLKRKIGNENLLLIKTFLFPLPALSDKFSPGFFLSYHCTRCCYLMFYFVIRTCPSQSLVSSQGTERRIQVPKKVTKFADLSLKIIGELWEGPNEARVIRNKGGRRLIRLTGYSWKKQMTR